MTRHNYYGFAIGMRVRTRETVKPRRYANRFGVVIRHNEGEIGVRFGSQERHGEAVWFYAYELTREIAGPRQSHNPGSGKPDLP